MVTHIPSGALSSGGSGTRNLPSVLLFLLQGSGTVEHWRPGVRKRGSGPSRPKRQFGTDGVKGREGARNTLPFPVCRVYTRPYVLIIDC